MLKLQRLLLYHGHTAHMILICVLKGVSLVLLGASGNPQASQGCGRRSTANDLHFGPHENLRLALYSVHKNAHLLLAASQAILFVVVLISHFSWTAIPTTDHAVDQACYHLLVMVPLALKNRKQGKLVL